MSKFKINPKVELYPFKNALGNLWEKVCNDVSSYIGKLESNNGGADVKATLSGVSVTAKCVLTSKEGYKLQMPLNNPMSILIRFGMELSKMDNNMDNRKVNDKGEVEFGGIQSPLPSKCVDWIEQQRNNAKTPAAEPVSK